MLLLTGSIGLAAGCASYPVQRETARAVALPEAPLSNVTRDDYAGSAACTSCHAEIAATWSRSAMHRMTRDIRQAEVHAPFDGTRFKFKADALVLEERDGQRFMRIESPSSENATYRVTRILGGRVREDFVGVRVGGAADEVVLPVSYLIEARTLRYKGYSVMVHERDGLAAGPRWDRTCIFCHNTVPEMDRLVGAIAGRAARPYQGEQVDRWLPVERRQSLRIRDLAGYAQDISGELSRFGVPVSSAHEDARELSRDATEAIRSGFRGDDLVEVGIGCEACHGGARRHARDPRVRVSLSPVAPWLEAPSPPSNEAQAINRVCARCHQVLFSRYPFTWEGGRRDSAAGGSHINSGEGRDFLLGGCASAMVCTTCHDPHGGGRDVLRQLETPAGNALCTRCHEALRDPERVRMHAHHDPLGKGGVCVSCHMPRKNMGLDGRLTRYHRIGSPTDAARVVGDRPLECALCHADKSVGSIVDTMEAWWPMRVPRQSLRDLYGSLDANVLRATLAMGKPHEQVVAMATLAEHHATDAVPAIAARLVSEYPLVREWAKRSLVTLSGRCDVDLSADDAAIARQATVCGGQPVAAPHGPTSHEDAED